VLPKPASGTASGLCARNAVLDSLAWPAGRSRNDTEIVRIVDANLQRLAKADALSGVVYIAARDSVIYERAFDLADREDSIPNRTRTLFAIASMGKVFTATARSPFGTSCRIHQEWAINGARPGARSPG
jgi:CubicO group peptidase (beta-lactamase class C family)